MKTRSTQILTTAFFLFVVVIELQGQDILLTNSRDKLSWGIPTTEYFFDAQIKNIPIRKVRVNGYLQTQSKGTVVLTSGGKGQSYYATIYNDPSREMIKVLHDEGLEIFEIRYDDDEGWAEHCEGIGGYSFAVELYAEMVKHLQENYFVNKEIVMATGNSGGSFQIAFGLTDHGLDNILDMVVLTGGPPVSNLQEGVFGDNSLDTRWPNGLIGGLRLTDYLMGWSQEMYCQNRTAPDSIVNILSGASLASTTSPRKFEYSTFVNFVQSDDPSNAHNQARIYHDSIKSDKAWYDLPDVDLHAVPSSEMGAQKIQDLILNYLETTSVIDPFSIGLDFDIHPNPTENELTVGDVTGMFEVINIQGKVLLNGDLYPNQSINVDKLRTGIYLIRIYENKGGVFLKKFKKQ